MNTVILIVYNRFAVVEAVTTFSLGRGGAGREGAQTLCSYNLYTFNTRHGYVGGSQKRSVEFPMVERQKVRSLTTKKKKKMVSLKFFLVLVARLSDADGSRRCYPNYYHRLIQDSLARGCTSPEKKCPISINAQNLLYVPRDKCTSGPCSLNFIFFFSIFCFVQRTIFIFFILFKQCLITLYK